MQKKNFNLCPREICTFCPREICTTLRHIYLISLHVLWKKICSHLTTDVVTWIAFEFVLNSTPCYSQSRYEFNKTYWGRLWCMRESSSMKSILNQNLWYLYVYWHTTDFRQWPFLLSALLHTLARNVTLRVLRRVQQRWCVWALYLKHTFWWALSSIRSAEHASRCRPVGLSGIAISKFISWWLIELEVLLF